MISTGWTDTWEGGAGQQSRLTPGLAIAHATLAESAPGTNGRLWTVFESNGYYLGAVYREFAGIRSVGIVAGHSLDFAK